MKLIFNLLVFPGFLFAATVGLFAGWFDRKVTARIQWRVGPPLFQNFWDILKLLGKETILPESAKITFLLAPYMGLISVSIVSTMLGLTLISPQIGFAGDLIVVIYLLLIPAVATMLGASSSRNPLASVGASREMKLVLAYELPFLLSIITVIIKNSGSIQLGQVLEFQRYFGSNIFSVSGILAFIVAVLCMQAKLGLVPFDASEAEQEIMAGVLIEYSGLPLAVFKVVKAMLLYTMPLLIIVLFMGRDTDLFFLSAKFISLLLVMVLIKNTNPRLRIDQIMRFFWRLPTALGLLAVILAIFGY
jgi:NADH-quinone oxidoreductase subunit H